MHALAGKVSSDGCNCWRRVVAKNIPATKRSGRHVGAEVGDCFQRVENGFGKETTSTEHTGISEY